MEEKNIKEFAAMQEQIKQLTREVAKLSDIIANLPMQMNETREMLVQLVDQREERYERKFVNKELYNKSNEGQDSRITRLEKLVNKVVLGSIPVLISWVVGLIIFIYIFGVK